MSKATAPKKAAKKRARLAIDPDHDMCFVIMPFGYPFDDYYQDVFIPGIKEAKLFPRRADDLFRASAIVNDIWELTKKAKIILADVSTKNANVFYELGLAHAIAKPAVIITQSMDDVPFDLRSLRVIVYDKNKSNWGDSLRNNIAQALKETLESPAGSVLPTFLNASELKQEIKISEKDFFILKSDVEALKNSISTKTQGSLVPAAGLSLNSIMDNYIQTFRTLYGIREGDILVNLTLRSEFFDFLDKQLQESRYSPNAKRIIRNRFKDKFGIPD